MYSEEVKSIFWKATWCSQEVGWLFLIATEKFAAFWSWRSIVQLFIEILKKSFSRDAKLSVNHHFLLNAIFLLARSDFLVALFHFPCPTHGWNTAVSLWRKRDVLLLIFDSFVLRFNQLKLISKIAFFRPQLNPAVSCLFFSPLVGSIWWWCL